MPDPLTLAVRGDFSDLNYRFVRGIRTVAVVSTLEESSGNFSIEVRPCEEQGVILFAALAIRYLSDEAGEAHAPNGHRVNRGAGVAVESGMQAVG
jgi:hypothetical protein